MAPGSAVKKKTHKRPKNRANKIHLVFDEAKRRDFLTGFHKRKLQRKKEAREKLEQDLKEERKRLKTEAKEHYKKLVVSRRPIPELETLLKEEYEDDDATVRIEELSTAAMAKQSNWIGPNQAKFDDSESEIEQKDGGEEEADVVPGMELGEEKMKVVKEKTVKQTFETERDVKRLLKKEATRKVKKSKVFQMKGKMEKQKQKKKSMQVKRQRVKLKERKTKKRH